MASKDTMVVNDVKELVGAYFKAVSRHFFGQAEKNHERHSEHDLFPARHLNH
jgi:hypothetical protein